MSNGRKGDSEFNTERRGNLSRVFKKRKFCRGFKKVNVRY